jgi:DNA polymerase V
MTELLTVGFCNQSEAASQRGAEEVHSPLLASYVQAGFPSPASEYFDRQVDLNKLLISNAAATYLFRIKEGSMQEANIYEGDVLIVDRSLQAWDNCLILACLDGDFTVKRLTRQGKKHFLTPANPGFGPIDISPDSDFRVWGVVRYIIHRVR